jgi:hypothetical protein
MDSNASSTPTESNTSEQTTTNKISQATGEYIHNNYETWIRKVFGFAFTILSFIRSTVMQIIAQVFSK